MREHCYCCDTVRSRFLNLFQFPSSGTDFISAFAALGWVLGLVIITPFDSTKTYAEMEKIVPLWIWSIIFISLFITQCISLLKTPSLYRSIVSLAAAGIWAAVSGLTFMATPWMPGPWVFGVIAIANAWAYGQHEVSRWTWTR